MFGHVVSRSAIAVKRVHEAASNEIEEAHMWWTLASVAWGFDHGHAAFGAVLEEAVGPEGVDYGVLAGRRAALDAYLDGLRRAPVTTFDAGQQLAFWVNAYNALTLALVLDAGVPASIRSIDGGNPWERPVFVVGDQTLTLNQIEHERARPLADGRVHAVLNCASKGCPPLPPDPLSATGLDAQLDAAAARWAASNAFRVEGDRVLLSQVFDWYGTDFVGETKGDIPKAEGHAEAALWFLSRFVPAEVGAQLTSGALEPSWMPYDWSLNRR